MPVVSSSEKRVLNLLRKHRILFPTNREGSVFPEGANEDKTPDLVIPITTDCHPPTVHLTSVRQGRCYTALNKATQQELLTQSDILRWP